MLYCLCCVLSSRVWQHVAGLIIRLWLILNGVLLVTMAAWILLELHMRRKWISIQTMLVHSRMFFCHVLNMSMLTLPVSLGMVGVMPSVFPNFWRDSVCWKSYAVKILLYKCKIVLENELLHDLIYRSFLIMSKYMFFEYPPIFLLRGHKRQEEHPVCKNWVMRCCWCGYVFGMRCRLFTYSPVDATAPPQKKQCLLPH